MDRYGLQSKGSDLFLLKLVSVLNQAAVVMPDLEGRQETSLTLNTCIYSTYEFKSHQFFLPRFIRMESHVRAAPPMVFHN